ncbi:MAG: hypothetical protein V7K88_05955 [Nostoc sp.]|uniref:hypothetical protein n=1 Tax=Nostoc sp. TaxID=1180 RepID=UPI002FF8B249
MSDGLTDIAILKEMINETATVSLENDDYGKNKVILREPPPANYDVTIYGMPDDDEVIIINADKFKSPDTVFKGNRGECKRADFVIVADTGKKKVILCIEMKAKASTSTEWEIIQQLKGAQFLSPIANKLVKSIGDKRISLILVSIALSPSEISTFIRNQHGRK